jgi:hypothetical protein
VVVWLIIKKRLAGKLTGDNKHKLKRYDVHLRLCTLYTLHRTVISSRHWKDFGGDCVYVIKLAQY